MALVRTVAWPPSVIGWLVLSRYGVLQNLHQGCQARYGCRSGSMWEILQTRMNEETTIIKILKDGKRTREEKGEGRREGGREGGRKGGREGGRREGEGGGREGEEKGRRERERERRWKK